MDKITIIIPVYNEEKALPKLLNNIDKYKDKAEIIFVDGGSTDNTLDLIGDTYKVVHSDRGRAVQMKRGAKESTGDILLFLHADSLLPDNALDELREVLKQYQVGCFGIRFDDVNLWMMYCQIVSNRRARVHRIVFGDQGMFLRRELFMEMGMFKEIPLMEDYQFSLDMREKNIRIGMTKHRIITSRRRYKRGKEQAVMNHMRYLRKLYREGEDINKIAAMYENIR